MSGLLIYDGDCGFCTSTAARMSGYFLPSVQVKSWQSLEMAEFGLTKADGQNSSWWINEHGQAFPGAEGIGLALGHTNRSWTKFCGRLITLAPVQPLAKAVYRVVVRFRHKLPGSTDACRMIQD